MPNFRPDEPFHILRGDSLRILPTLPDRSIQACVTSPPYWGLRDYRIPPSEWGGDPSCAHAWATASYRRDFGGSRFGDPFVAGGGANAERVRKARRREDGFCSKCGAWRGCLGIEPSPELYVEHLVAVLREVRRVLRDDGTLWLNLGDCYAGSWGNYGAKSRTGNPGSEGKALRSSPKSAFPPPTAQAPGLKPKDLVGIPWRAAFALREDGWLLRSDVIWEKPNCLPESASDRPTNSHEHLFLLAKSRRYFYDGEAIREPLAPSTPARDRSGFRRAFATQLREGPDGDRFPNGKSLGSVSFADGRNKRSVWTVATRSGFGGHSAAFPPGLVEPCILAGTSEKGCCRACGSPWKRVVGIGEPNDEWRRACGGDRNGEYHGRSRGDAAATGGRDPGETKRRILEGMRRRVTLGWEPDCGCSAAEPVSCLVLDPFCGSGTTGWVARRLGRRFLGIELKEEYADLAEGRIGSAASQAHGEKPVLG